MASLSASRRLGKYWYFAVSKSVGCPMRQQAAAELLASWKEYWAFHDPVLARAVLQPVGDIYTLDSLMPREEFAATPVFNEFWRKGELSLAAAGANLVVVEDQFSAMICFSNAPNGDSLTAQQIHIFEAVLRHLTRAVRINRRLWELELEGVAATERLEALQQGALLADASGRVVRANAAAKAMLDEGDGIFLDNGRSRRRRLRNSAKADRLLRANLSVAWRPRRRI